MINKKSWLEKKAEHIAMSKEFSQGWEALKKLYKEIERDYGGLRGTPFEQRNVFYQLFSLLIRAGRKIVREVTKFKQIPNDKKTRKDFEMATRILSKMRRIPNKPWSWVKKYWKRMQLIADSLNWPEKSEGATGKFSFGPFTVHNVIGLDLNELEDAKSFIEVGRKAMANSGIPKVRDILYGDVFLVGQHLKSRTLAWYYSDDDTVHIRTEKSYKGGNYSHNLIHEFGHRFFRKKMSYTQKTLNRNFYHDLSGVRVPYVRAGFKFENEKGEEREIVKVTTTQRTIRYWISEDRFYTRKNFETLLKGKSFPTVYSMTNQEEFFCECFAMYCLGTLKPEHKEGFERIFGIGGASVSTPQTEQAKKEEANKLRDNLSGSFQDIFDRVLESLDKGKEGDLFGLTPTSHIGAEVSMVAVKSSTGWDWSNLSATDDTYARAMRDFTTSARIAEFVTRSGGSIRPLNVPKEEFLSILKFLRNMIPGSYAALERGTRYVKIIQKLKDPNDKGHIFIYKGSFTDISESTYKIISKIIGKKIEGVSEDSSKIIKGTASNPEVTEKAFQILKTLRGLGHEESLDLYIKGERQGSVKKIAFDRIEVFKGSMSVSTMVPFSVKAALLGYVLKESDMPDVGFEGGERDRFEGMFSKIKNKYLGDHIEIYEILDFEGNNPPPRMWGSIEIVNFSTEEEKKPNSVLLRRISDKSEEEMSFVEFSKLMTENITKLRLYSELSAEQRLAADRQDDEVFSVASKLREVEADFRLVLSKGGSPEEIWVALPKDGSSVSFVIQSGESQSPYSWSAGSKNDTAPSFKLATYIVYEGLEYEIRPPSKEEEEVEKISTKTPLEEKIEELSSFGEGTRAWLSSPKRGKKIALIEKLSNGKWEIIDEGNKSLGRRFKPKTLAKNLLEGLYNFEVSFIPSEDGVPDAPELPPEPPEVPMPPEADEDSDPGVVDEGQEAILSDEGLDELWQEVMTLNADEMAVLQSVLSDENTVAEILRYTGLTFIRAAKSVRSLLTKGLVYRTGSGGIDRDTELSSDIIDLGARESILYRLGQLQKDTDPESDPKYDLDLLPDGSKVEITFLTRNLDPVVVEKVGKWWVREDGKKTKSKTISRGILEGRFAAEVIFEPSDEEDEEGDDFLDEEEVFEEEEEESVVDTLNNLPEGTQINVFSAKRGIFKFSLVRVDDPKWDWMDPETGKKTKSKSLANKIESGILTFDVSVESPEEEDSEERIAETVEYLDSMEDETRVQIYNGNDVVLTAIYEGDGLWLDFETFERMTSEELAELYVGFGDEGSIYTID